MKFFFLFLLFILSVIGSSQEATFTIIKDVPALEGYDLLKDRKGYIWLGHDLGISRYSGQNFINFSNPQQNALSMTDLWEDNEGKIWSHNFEGQIYYVDQFKLKLLEAYRFAEEPSYPRIGICNDELLATSSKGLFVCNTKTFSSEYYLLDNGITSLCVLDNKVLLYGKGNWYVYRKGEKIKKIAEQNFSLSKIEGVSLSQTGKKDTAFMISNPEGNYYKLLIEDDRLVCLAKKNANGFINSMTVAEDNVWIHTKSKSFKEGAHDTIYNNSISDLVKDNNGNLFYSNLKTGLAVQYANSAKTSLKTGVIDQNDFIRKLLTDDGGFVCGTQKGKLLMLSNELNKKVELSIPGHESPIELIFKIAPDEYLAGIAMGIFSVNFKKRKVVAIDNSVILKDIAIDGDSIFLATTTGVLKTSINRLISTDPYKQSKFQYSVIKAGRTRTIARSGTHPYFLCSFSDGVYKIENNSATPLLYNEQRIYATSIRSIGKKMIIGTFNQGLFIIDGKEIRNITNKDGLISNSVKSIKIFDNRAWIIFHGFIQTMNEELNVVPAPDIPFKGSLIYDLVEKKRSNKILIAANNGIYEVSADFKRQMADPPTIDFILINGKDTATGKSIFSHSQNNLQINLSTPFFKELDPLRYKYRFYQKTGSNWQISDENQKIFNLLALQPGNYVFEAIPINHAGLAIAKPLMQRILIKPAWYQTIFFKAVVISAGILLVFFLMRLYYNYRLKIQKRDYEQMLVIQKERQRISSEMHDDLGAGLSGVRLLTEITMNKLKDKGATDDIDKIYQAVGEISSKMKEVIWSLSSENDGLDSLVHYIQKQVRQLMENYPGELIFEIPEKIPDRKISGEMRRHVYLAVKEAVHNIIKHSGADKIKISMSFNEKMIIAVSDNGIGMADIQSKNTGFGMKNMRQRIQQLEGNLSIKNEKGLTVVFEVPLK